MKNLSLPDKEFKMRWQKVQEGVKKQGLDAILVHSHEADFAGVRYLSDYWPIFESAGVLVPAEGAPALIIGPESETFAAARSRIKKIYKMVEYRESAEPDYPGIKVDTFESIFRETFGKKKIKKIGLEGYQIFPLPIYESLKKALPGTEIAKSSIVSDLRIIKSPAELALRYVLSIEGVTSVLVGVDSSRQMEENLRLFEKGPLGPDLMADVIEAVPDLSDDILMPDRWSARCG